MCTVSTSYKANERCYSGNITYACLLNSMLNLVWTFTVAKVIKKIWQSHGSSDVFHDRWKIILVKTFALQEPKRAPGAAKHMLAFCTYISCHLGHSCSNKTGVPDCWFPTDTLQTAGLDTYLSTDTLKSTYASGSNTVFKPSLVI